MCYCEKTLYELNMKIFQIEIVVLLAISCFVSVQLVQGNDCECFSSWKTYGIGRREPGDQLLFREIRSSNWTTIINHNMNFAYSNTNITAWELGMAPVIKGKLYDLQYKL